MDCYFAGIYFSDINPIQYPEITFLTHNRPTPLSLNPETCLDCDRTLCSVPAYNNSLKQLHPTQRRNCMGRSNVKQPEEFNCDQHVNGSVKLSSDLKTHVFNQSGNIKEKESRYHQKKKPGTKISRRKVFSRAAGSVSLKKSAGVRGQCKNKSQGRSKSCAEIPQFNFGKLSPLFSDENTNSFLFTKSCQDLAKLSTMESNSYDEPNIFYQHLSRSDEDRSESPLLDKLSEVAVCNEILVTEKKTQHKVYRNSHNSHLYTFDNPSLANLTDLTKKPFGCKTEEGFWTEKDNSRNLPRLCKKTKNENNSPRYYADVSLPGSPYEKQFLLTTLLSSDAEAEIEYKLKDPIPFPLCPLNTVPSDHGKQNGKEPKKGNFQVQEGGRLKSADDQNFEKLDVIVRPDGVVNCNHDRKSRTRGFNDFYDDARFENVYSSQSDVPSQYVMLQSAKLKYYQTYVQSMRPKTSRREKWYGSASFGRERCPCCTPALRPRNASPKLNGKCSSPQCCQNLRLHPTSRFCKTPEPRVNSKVEDRFIPKRLTKSATFSNGRTNFAKTQNKYESLNTRKKKDYIVKRGRKFEPLEVKCLDIEDVFEVENNFDIGISKGHNAVPCTGRGSRLSDVKVDKWRSCVRSVSPSRRPSSNTCKTVRFKEGYGPKMTGRSRIKSPEIPECISPKQSSGYSEEEWMDGGSINIPESCGKDFTDDARSQLVELLNDQKTGKLQIEESNRHVCKESTEEGSNDDMASSSKQNTSKESEESSSATDKDSENRNTLSILQSEDSFESNTSELSKQSESRTGGEDTEDTTYSEDQLTCEVTKQDSLYSTLSSEDSSSRSPQTDMRQLLDLKPPAPRRKYSSESIPSIIISDEEGNENELDIETVDEEQETTEELGEDTTTTDEEDIKIREEFDRVVNLGRPKTGRNRKGRSQIRWQEIKDEEEISEINKEMLAPHTVFNGNDRVKRNKKRAKVEVHPQAHRQKNSLGKEKKIEKGKLSLKNVNYFCSPDFLKMKVKRRVARKMKGMGIIQEQEWVPDSKRNQMAAPKIVVTEDTSSGTGNSSEEEGDGDARKHQAAGMLIIPENVMSLNEKNDPKDDDQGH